MASTTTATPTQQNAVRQIKYGRYLKKAAGLGAIAMVLHDANHIAKTVADQYACSKDAAAVSHYQNNTLYTDDMSKTQSNIKKLSYKMTLNDSTRRFFNLGIGYIKGFFAMLVNLAVPFVLGLGALSSKKTISRASVAGLGIYGLYKFIKNFFGIGVPKGPLN
jgi:hypothetical protein